MKRIIIAIVVVLLAVVVVMSLLKCTTGPRETPNQHATPTPAATS